MKLRVLFLKRKHVFYFLLVLVVFTFFIISRMSNNTSSPIFKVSSFNKAYRMDLTGDGKGDVLYITANKGKYLAQVNSQKDSFYLEPNKKLNSMGLHTPHWPMRVKLFDISRDNVPEIFIQSSENNKPIQHVFMYTNNKFEDIFCSSNNVLGFIDCTNNKTPKLISGKIDEANFQFSNYILLQGKFERYDFNAAENFMGKDTVLNFINLITSNNLQGIQIKEEVFDAKTISNSSSAISKIMSLGKNFIFQDGTFMDTKSNSNGEPSQVQWILNFRGNSLSEQNEIKNLTLILNLKASKDPKESFYYKIYSIIVDKNM